MSANDRDTALDAWVERLRARKITGEEMRVAWLIVTDIHQMSMIACMHHERRHAPLVRNAIGLLMAYASDGLAAPLRSLFWMTPEEVCVAISFCDLLSERLRGSTSFYSFDYRGPTAMDAFCDAPEFFAHNAGEKKAAKVVEAFNFVLNNPGALGKEITASIGLESSEDFRKRIVPALRKLGVTNNGSGYFAPQDAKPM